MLIAVRMQQTQCMGSHAWREHWYICACDCEWNYLKWQIEKSLTILAYLLMIWSKYRSTTSPKLAISKCTKQVRESVKTICWIVTTAIAFNLSCTMNIQLNSNPWSPILNNFQVSNQCHLLAMMHCIFYCISFKSIDGAPYNQSCKLNSAISNMSNIFLFLSIAVKTTMGPPSTSTDTHGSKHKGLSYLVAFAVWNSQCFI